MIHANLTYEEFLTRLVKGTALEGKVITFADGEVKVESSSQVKQTIFDIKMENGGCWHKRSFMDWTTALNMYADKFDNMDVADEDENFTIDEEYRVNLGISDEAYCYKSFFTTDSGASLVVYEISDWENNHRGYISVEQHLHGDWRTIIPEPF